MEQTGQEKVDSVARWLGREALLTLPVINLIACLLLIPMAKTRTERNYYLGWLAAAVSITVMLVVI